MRQILRDDRWNVMGVTDMSSAKSPLSFFNEAIAAWIRLEHESAAGWPYGSTRAWSRSRGQALAVSAAVPSPVRSCDPRRRKEG